MNLISSAQQFLNIDSEQRIKHIVDWYTTFSPYTNLYVMPGHYGVDFINECLRVYNSVEKYELDGFLSPYYNSDENMFYFPCNIVQLICDLLTVYYA